MKLLQRPTTNLNILYRLSSFAVLKKVCSFSTVSLSQQNCRIEKEIHMPISLRVSFIAQSLKQPRSNTQNIRIFPLFSNSFFSRDIVKFFILNAFQRKIKHCHCMYYRISCIKLSDTSLVHFSDNLRPPLKLQMPQISTTF